MLGNGRLMAACCEGGERLCIIRGNMRKREWVSVGDVLLISLRDYQEGKADIIFRYSPTEVNDLIKYKEITAQFAKGDPDQLEESEDVLFGEEDIDPGAI